MERVIQDVKNENTTLFSTGKDVKVYKLFKYMMSDVKRRWLLVELPGSKASNRKYLNELVRAGLVESFKSFPMMYKVKEK